LLTATCKIEFFTQKQFGAVIKMWSSIYRMVPKCCSKKGDSCSVGWQDDNEFKNV